jgi:RNA polymerase sigma-70 factor (ECF subfamily)
VNREDHRSDAALLRACAGDPSAFAVLYDRYEPSMVAFLGARVRDPELTADLAAEVFAVVLERADQFDPGRAAGENAAPWLFAIARNTLFKSLRRGRVAADARHRLGMTEPLALEDDGYARVEAAASRRPDLDVLLDGLPDDQRAALIARVVDEREYEDIAKDLECSPLVVRKRVSRALAALRSSFAKETES